MKARSWLPGLTAGLFGLAGCLAKPAQAADLRTQIEMADAKFVAAAAKGDSAALASLYTEDAQLMPPGSEPLQGRQYIVVWRSEHRRWKLHRDMFSTNLPSARN